MAAPRKRQGAASDRALCAELFTLRSLPKAQRQWALFFLQDIAGKLQRLPDDRLYIERSPGYYGRTPESISRKLVPYLLGDALMGIQVSNRDAYAADLPLRKLTRESPYHGVHWVLPPGAATSAKALADHLTADGDEVPEGAFFWVLADPSAQPVQVVKKGKRTWMHCPEHDDRDPSALINDNGLIYCFGCGKIVGKAEQSSTGLLYRKVLSSSPGIQGRTEPAPTTPVEVADDHMGVDLSTVRSTTTLPYSIFLADSAGSPGAPVAGVRGPAVGMVGQGYDEKRDQDFDLKKTIRAIGIVRCLRHSDRPLTRYGKSGMSKGYAEKTDLLDVIRSANRATRGGALQRAQTKQAIAEGLDHRHELPDRYAHLDWCRHTSVRVVPLGARGKMRDLSLVKPEGFQVAATEWVGVDLDGFTSGPVNDSELLPAVEKIAKFLENHPSFSGRFGLIRTSHLGIQVVAQLKRVRWDPTSFYANSHVQRMLAALDHVVLEAVREAGMVGGHIDPSIHRAGRLFRLPGARVDKFGIACLSRLIYATE